MKKKKFFPTDKVSLTRIFVFEWRTLGGNLYTKVNNRFCTIFSAKSSLAVSGFFLFFFSFVLCRDVAGIRKSGQGFPLCVCEFE